MRGEREAIATVHRVDGIPSAELAAARVKLLTPEELFPRLDQRLPLHQAGGVTRHGVSGRRVTPSPGTTSSAPREQELSGNAGLWVVDRGGRGGARTRAAMLTRFLSLLLIDKSTVRVDLRGPESR